MDKKKQRPYSDFEKQLLLQLVNARIAVIENRKTDGVTQKQKMEAWEEIASIFNISEGVNHLIDIKQIKKMWQNMKGKARDAKTLESQSKRTGGGPPPPEMGPLDSQVIAIVPHIMPTIEVPIDSDTLEGGTGQEDNDSLFWQPKTARQDTDVIIKDIIVSNKAPIIEMSIDAPGPSKEVKQKRKSFDELKNELLVQELKQNKKKFELEMAFLEENQKIEIEFIKAKQKLELEILEIRKMKELEK